MEIKSGDARPIAILLAVYNGEKYLSEQIDSILDQTNTSWILYIRNDGSSDGTQRIIDSYLRRFPDRIVQIDRGGANLGCRGNFFRLLETVEADYYMFSDADDVWLPEKIQRSFSLLKQKEQLYPGTAILVHTDKVVCDDKMNIIVPSWWKAVRLNPDLFHSLRCIPLSPVVGGATTVFNRFLRDLCLPIPEDPPQHDCWIPLQAAKYGKIFALHDPLILYRQHGNNAVGAPTEPYRFRWGKIGRIKRIVQRDWNLAGYYRRLGYGSRLKYFFTRFEVLIKLQWSKITYK